MKLFQKAVSAPAQPAPTLGLLRVGETDITRPSASARTYDDVRDRANLYAKVSATFGEGTQVLMIDNDSEGHPYLGVKRTSSGETPVPPDSFMSRTGPLDPLAKGVEGLDARLRTAGGWAHAFPDLRRSIHSRHPRLLKVNMDGTVVVGFMTPWDEALRDRIARSLGCKPWDVGLSVAWGTVEDDDGKLIGEPRAVAITHAPVIADAEKRVARWKALANELLPTAAGSAWRVEDEPHLGRLNLRIGASVNLPTSVPYLWSVATGAEWCDLAFGVDGFGQPVSVDLSSNPHVLVVGKTGSGKSITLEAFIFGALVHGFELAIVDPTKRGLDFRWARPFVREGGWGCQTYADALATLRSVYDEGQRRLDILDSLDLPKWTALSDEQRAEYGIGPILVVLDEGTSFAKLDVVPRGLPADDPERREPEELNITKQRSMALTGKIARELRFVGIHLIFGTQRFGVEDIGEGAGGLRENLGNRILLGRASSTAIGMAVMDPSDALSAYEEAHGVAAQKDERKDKEREKRPGRGIVEMDGQETTSFHGFYATHEELAERLALAGVERRKPAADPAAASVEVELAAAEVPDSYWDDDEDEVSDTPEERPVDDELTPEPALVPTSRDGSAYRPGV